MPISATLKLMLKWKDTSANAYVSPNDNSRTWVGDVEKTLDANSTPDAENGATVLITLTGGVGSIDLTALLHLDGDTRSATGKKIRAWLFKNLGANLMTITKGAANGYSPIGSTFTKVLAPTAGASGDDFHDGALDVDATHKILDVTGTGAQQLLVKVVWG